MRRCVLLRELRELNSRTTPATPANAGVICGSVFTTPVGGEITPATPATRKHIFKLPQLGLPQRRKNSVVDVALARSARAGAGGQRC
jgi:hypothetical protein